MEILAFVLSILGTVCICASFLIKGKNMKLILLLACITNVLTVASYALTGAYNGALTCCIGVGKLITNYCYERKNKQPPRWTVVAFLGASVVVSLLVFSSFIDIVPILSAFVYTVGISGKNGRHYRIWMLVNTGLWVVYDLVTLSFGPLCSHLIQIGTILFGMFMYDRKKEVQLKAE